MSRWLIEKSGTGIEKSGTGIEKSGTGIEKSGTGIEKSGTGIEKSGTGIRKLFFACSIFAMTFASSLSAAPLSEKGVLTAVVDNGQLTVAWIFNGSAFVGFGDVKGSYVNFSLMESYRSVDSTADIAGGGTGARIAGGGTGADIAGGGTGTDIAGGGTGTKTKIAGGGTGVDIAGGGTGTDIAGGGTGTRIAGGGTGADIAGGGTGSDIAGGGTGNEGFGIALPSDTQLEMEVSLDCNTANIVVTDADGYEVVTFENVKVKGDTGLCNSESGLDPVEVYDIQDLYRDR